jgi:glyoxylase-like metal-dependent hydrolase (beta-lactamase superfamily II)
LLSIVFPVKDGEVTAASKNRAAERTPHRKIGVITIYALTDGVIETPPEVLVGVEEPEARRLVGDRAQSGPFELGVNNFLLDYDGRWMLIDAGAGHTMGPRAGKLVDNLRAIGIEPSDIETILLTHIHPDHSNGLVDAQGRAHFPNAKLVVHEDEVRFWLDRDLSTVAERFHRNIAFAKAATDPYRERMRLATDGEAMPGITAIPLPGHTAGHTGWLIHSGTDSVLVWGDTVHLAPVQIPRPEVGLIFDLDSVQAAATRRRIFDQVATDRVEIGGAHMDYPGFGFMRRVGNEYRFEPSS